MKKVLAPLLAMALGFGVLPLTSQPATAAVSFPAGGLDFTNPFEEDILEASAVGDFYIYENINGAGAPENEIYAKLTILGLTNSVAPNPNLTNEVILDSALLDDFYTFIDDGVPETEEPSPRVINVRYSTNNGSTWTEGASFTVGFESWFEYLNVFDDEARFAEYLRLQAWLRLSLGATPVDPEDVQVEIQVEYETEGTETWPSPTTWDPVGFSAIDYPEPNKLDVADQFSGNVTRDRWIRASFDNGAEDPIEVRIEYKIEFFDSLDQPVTFNTLSVNAYDIDAGQYVEFQDVQSYSLTDNTIIDSVEEVGGLSTHLKFTSADDMYAATDPEDDEVHSYGEARVQVNFANVSVIYLSMGTPGSGASQQFDFSGGVAWDTLTGPLGSAPAPTVITELESGGSNSRPVVSVIDVNPTNITVDREIITIFGANLSTVTSVYIGGIKVKIFSQSGNRLQVRAPKGLSGAVDLELKSAHNDVLMKAKIKYGEVAASERKAVLIVGGFDHNSRKLTKKMKAKINRWLERNSDLSTLTCTGFTSLPRRTTDVALSTNRGITACNFSKKQRVELLTSVSQGIEDPKPGSNIRRVRLVLTQ